MGRLSEIATARKLSQDVEKNIGTFAGNVWNDTIRRTGGGRVQLGAFEPRSAIVNGKRIIEKSLTASTMHIKATEVVLTDENGDDIFVSMTDEGRTSAGGRVLTGHNTLLDLPALLTGKERRKAAITTIGNRLNSGLAVATYIGQQAEATFGLVPNYPLLDDMKELVSGAFPGVQVFPQVEEIIRV